MEPIIAITGLSNGTLILFCTILFNANDISTLSVPKLLNDFDRENRMKRVTDALGLLNETPTEIENLLVTSDEF